jgi:hypothetical protein
MTDALRRSDGVGDIPQSKDPARGFPVATAVRPVDGDSLAMGLLSMSLWALLTLLMASGVWAAAPIVDSFSASPAVVAPGGLVTLEVNAHDPDCPSTCTTGCGQYLREDLIAWSASGGTFLAENNGTSGSPYVATADWSAPAAEGTYTVSVNLADSGGMLCGGRQSTTAQLSVLVTTSPNRPPEISLLTTNPAQLFPGETSLLTCIATDPDGDPLSFGWSSDLGVVTENGEGTAFFSAVDPGVATITCKVTDNGGATTRAEVQITVSTTFPARSLTGGLRAPQKLAIDSMGDLYVADRSAGGITVIHLFSGEVVYRLPLAAVTSVEVDWKDDLLVGTAQGAQVLDRTGRLVLDLVPPFPLGPVSDVAVDSGGRFYAVLHQTAGRVMVFDASGIQVSAFGSTGDGPAQLKSPQAIAFTRAGEVVVADSGHGLIKIFDRAGSLQRSFGGLGGDEFVQLADVAVGRDGTIYASDAFQAWVQTTDQFGVPREVIGTYGEGVGEFKTATGVLPADDWNALVVASSNGPSLEVFELGGRSPTDVPHPDALLSTFSLDFGIQPVGTPSGTLSLTLSNPGTSPLGIRQVVLQGDFTQTNDCGLFLEPGTPCTFSIRFIPISAGALSGSLRIDTSADNGVLTVALGGTGVVPTPVVELTPAPMIVVFADVPVGSRSDPQTLAVTNTGTVSTTITGLDLVGFHPGDFSLESDLCTGAELAVGDWCELGAVFAPTADGLRGAEIAILTDSGQVFSVTLRGGNAAGFADGFETGDMSRWSATSSKNLVTVSPSVISFPRQELDSDAIARQVTVTNHGRREVWLGVFEIVGEGVVAVDLESDWCGGTWLDGGASCTVVVSIREVMEGSYSVRIGIPIFTDHWRKPLQIELEGTASWLAN